jgi:hypothetical protein
MSFLDLMCSMHKEESISLKDVDDNIRVGIVIGLRKYSKTLYRVELRIKPNVTITFMVMCPKSTN